LLHERLSLLPSISHRCVKDGEADDDCLDEEEDGVIAEKRLM
jgi:hypothetical protein